MRRFFQKIFLTGIVIYSGLWGLQFIVDNGLRKNQNNTFKYWNKAYNGEINADVVFFGSSRTLVHYDPKIFDEKLGLNTINLGSDGTAYDIQNIKIDAYLNNNGPLKAIILNVDAFSLGNTKKLYDKKQYIPFYTFKNYKALAKVDNNITLEYLVPLYKYRGYHKLFRESYEGYTQKDWKRGRYKGYNGKDRKWDDDYSKFKPSLKDGQFPFNKENLLKKFVVFDATVDKLAATNALVCLVWAPQYIVLQNMEANRTPFIKNHFREKANEYNNVHFVDFTQDSINYSKDYFYNSFHLNKDGATIFSNKIADTLGVLLKQRDIN